MILLSAADLATLVAGGTVTIQGPVVAPPPPIESPNNTVISAGAFITDAQGNRWGIANAQATVNGKIDPVTNGVVKLAYVNKLIWQQNTANDWYSHSTAGWKGPVKVSPLVPAAPTITTIKAS